MLDLFRYGASLESWTAHLFLCATIGLYYLEPAKWRYPLLIIAATYLLVCSGHPQMMYFGMLGAGLFAVVIPFFIATRLPQHQAGLRDVFRFWLRIGCLFGIGILLSSAYILPFYFDFFLNNAHRVAQDYAWANLYRDTLMGTVNNFLQPLRSDVTGVFGGSSLILMGVWVPALILFKIRIPRVIWAIWGILFVAFLIMQGARTPLHYLAWKYLPFASSFRSPGRISLLMPIFFMLMLAWVVQAERFRTRFFRRDLWVYPRTIAAGAALLAIGVYLCLPQAIVSHTTDYSATAIRNIPPWVAPFSISLGAVALVVLMLHATLIRKQSVTGSVLCLIAGFQVILLMQYGTWIEPKKDTPQLSQMAAAVKQNLDYRLATGAFMETPAIAQQVKRSFLEPFLGRTYKRFRYAADTEMAYALMQQNRTPDQVIIEQYVPSSQTAHRSPGHKKLPGRVKLDHSSFNRLVFEVQVSGPSFFGLAYPHTGHWKAFVNNAPVQTYRANGAYHALEIPDGVSQVEFRYWSPAAFWGMIISCATLLFIGLFVSRRVFKFPLSVWAFAGLFVLVVGGFTLWYHSLYNGDNLKTVYIWAETPAARVPNLAYGKRTNMSSFLYPNFIYYMSSGRAVDGIRAPSTGFISGLETRPWWVVDLHQPKSFSEIVIYEGRNSSEFNLRPLTVAVSNEGKNWHTVKILSDELQDNPLRIFFNTPQTARYVMIRASGVCYLAFDEVEIYPAKKNISTTNMLQGKLF
jgi:hypothetical protein